MCRNRSALIGGFNEIHLEIKSIDLISRQVPTMLAN